MYKISGVILAKNEEKNISKAIQSLCFCDEIIIGDDNSSDKTADIARSLGATVRRIKIEGNFSKARNDLMNKARNDWILFLDADEIISNELSHEITMSKLDQFDCYRLKRCDVFLGKKIKHGDVKEAYEKGILRLIKKGSGTWKGYVHERFYLNRGKRESVFKNYLYHYSHKSVLSFLSKINTYSTYRAKELLQKGEKTSLFELLLYPMAKFFKTYFLQSGYKDGPEGFIYSFMMSFHSFLSRGKVMIDYHE